MSARNVGRYNVIAGVLLSRANHAKGLTIPEIMEATNYSRSSVVRLLKEPGFNVSVSPVWPPGYCFDVDDARRGISPKVTTLANGKGPDLSKPKAITSGPFIPFTTGYGAEIPNPPEGFSQATSKQLIAHLGSNDFVGPVGNAVIGANKGVAKMLSDVVDFKANGKSIPKEAWVSRTEQIVKMRNAGLLITMLADAILNDPRLALPEFFEIFDQEA